jgi:uncharacterized pyridoxamine 5'-phosphate oxidase family protein
MKETYQFLKEKTHFNFLSTIANNKPSCRPFGDPILYDNKIYIITKKHKDVSKQININNNVCIVAYDNNEWIRINCELVDDSNNIEAKKKVIEEFDWAEEAGYTLNNPDFELLYIKNATSTIYDEDGNIVNTCQF